MKYIFLLHWMVLLCFPAWAQVKKVKGTIWIKYVQYPKPVKSMIEGVDSLNQYNLHYECTPTFREKQTGNTIKYFDICQTIDSLTNKLKYQKNTDSLKKNNR